MESRKLKRGLRDVSPLFGPEAEPDPRVLPQRMIPPAHSVEIINVFSADRPDESLFYNTYLASRISGADFPSFVLSLEPSCRPEAQVKKTHQPECSSAYVRHFSIPLEQFEKIVTSPIHYGGLSRPEPQSIFIDFNPHKIPHPEKIISILDKWILLVQPTLESIMETYKMIKAARPINPHIEYFILIDGQLSETESSLLFERLSEAAAKHLGVQLNWLGMFSLSRRPMALPGTDRLNPAKISLNQFVQSFSDSVARHVG